MQILFLHPVVFLHKTKELKKEQAPQKDVQDIIIDIRRNLDESERIVTGTGEIAPAIAFTSSFAVIFH